MTSREFWIKSDESQVTNNQECWESRVTYEFRETSYEWVKSDESLGTNKDRHILSVTCQEWHVKSNMSSVTYQVTLQDWWGPTHHRQD